MVFHILCDGICKVKEKIGRSSTRNISSIFTKTDGCAIIISAPLIKTNSFNSVRLIIMLRELSIRNFAIIDDLNIRFSDGLTVLSGETGAGKSIIINAVNLLLGSRATATMVSTGAETAELEALFEITRKSRVAQLMTEQGYDPSEGLLIRRIISKNERHRIYINGRLSTIQILDSVTENLASISGQHAHQGLLKEEQHLLILDQFAGLMPMRNELAGLYYEIVPLVKKLKELNSVKDRRTEQIEYLSYQKKEIIDAAIKPGEDVSLEQDRTRLKNRETLFEAVDSSIEELYSAQGSVTERLGIVRKNLNKVSRLDPELSSKEASVAEAAYNIEETANSLRAYLAKIETDEKVLEAVESRIDVLNKLKRKYGGTLQAIFEQLDAILMELSGIENLSGTIDETQKKLGLLHKELAACARELSEKRRESAKEFALKVEKELSTLKMPRTKFEVSLQTQPASGSADLFFTTAGSIINETGIDRALFLIAPNVGESLKPLSGIASGGELSRVILALKALLAGTESVETIVFDEVDAGIGGGVAEVVGRKMASLARHHQIICITHLPQIAKFGDHHLRISKHVTGGRTRTTITPLAENERVEEIARMLGGEEITRATIAHAREMLESR
ncbi:MAG: DNA repair protein RecN [Desulfobacteraceae bacterium]|nr:MAG: DNA repair protein RecN [Desulfobacteraceae bacterium]